MRCRGWDSVSLFSASPRCLTLSSCSRSDWLILKCCVLKHMHRKGVGLIRNMFSSWKNYRLLSVKLFGRSVLSNSLRLHGLQHARFPCPSLSPGVCSNSIESVMPSICLILCHPLLLLPSIFPSIRVFSNKSALCIRWPKYWSCSFSKNPSNKYSGFISFRID